MAIFGYTTVGAGDLTPATVVNATKFTCPASGTVNKISAYIKLAVADNVKVAIYSDTGGYPVTLLAQSALVPVGIVSSWVDFPIVLKVTANMVYWLAILSPIQNITDAVNAGSANQLTSKIGYVNFPDPYPGGAPQYAYVMSIYATYQPSAQGIITIHAKLAKII